MSLPGEGYIISIKTPRKKKRAGDEKNDKRSPRERWERDPELENDTLHQLI